MTIEFPCPECAQLVRTPDAAAGKKGKCPSCNALVRIPATNPAPKQPATAAPAPKAAPKPAATPAPAASEDTSPIEFNCPGCGGVVRTPRAAAGKKGRCPTCAAVVVIPLPAAPPPAAVKPAAAAKPAPVVKPASAPAPKRAAATPAKKELKPAAASAPTPVAKPKPAPQPAPRPPAIEEVGLAPLEELAPLPELAPVPGLAPLDDLALLDDPVPTPSQSKSRATPSAADDEVIDLSEYDEPAAGESAAAAPAGDAMPPLVAVASNAADPFTTGRPEFGALLKAPLPALVTAAARPTNPGNQPALEELPVAELNALQPLEVLAANAFQPLAPLPGALGSMVQPGPSLGGPSPASINIPALLQIVCLAPWMLFELYRAVLMLFSSLAVLGRSPPPGTLSGGSQGLPPGLIVVGIIVGLAVTLFLLTFQFLIILGSVRQLQRRSYFMSHVAAWLSLIPCFSPMGFPFGIWSLVMLFKNDVKRTFGR